MSGAEGHGDLPPEILRRRICDFEPQIEGRALERVIDRFRVCAAGRTGLRGPREAIRQPRGRTGRMERLSQPLLVTDEVAELLQVHPKQIYRLLARGLPGRRVGREWRFDRGEVLGWVSRSGEPPTPPFEHPPRPPEKAALPSRAPSVVAANGDLAVELLLARMNAVGPPILGFLQSDRDGALELLQGGLVLLAGCHGREPAEQVGEIRLARIHLVNREIGLVGRAGEEVPEIGALGGLRLAVRPGTAGIRVHFDRALERAGATVERTTIHGSHRDVVLAVVRGEADVGLATRAWASRAGLPFRRLASEAYGLVLRAADLGDPRVVRLCEVAQGSGYRQELSAIPGYDPAESGAVQYHFS